jgi:hypothetical protein
MVIFREEKVNYLKILDDTLKSLEKHTDKNPLPKEVLLQNINMFSKLKFNYFLAFLVLLFFLSLFSCNKFERDKAVETTKINFDTISYSFDTIYNNIEINGSKFKLKIIRNKYDDNFHKYEDKKNAPPILILSDEDKDLFYKPFGSLEDKGFTHEIELFKINKEINEQGVLFVCFKVLGHGSGSDNFLYHFANDDNKFKLNKLFNYSTESIVLYNKNESILFLEEVWGEDETYWGCHQYAVKEFVFKNGYFSENQKGITKSKYCLSDSQNLKEDLKTIFHSETEIFKNIYVESYLNMIE